MLQPRFQPVRYIKVANEMKYTTIQVIFIPPAIQHCALSDLSLKVEIMGIYTHDEAVSKAKLASSKEL